MSSSAAYRTFIDRVKYNVPFGFKDQKGEFRTLVNINIDEAGNYVYYQNGAHYSIPALIAREKKVPQEDWFNHLLYINEHGRPVHFKSISVA